MKLNDNIFQLSLLSSILVMLGVMFKNGGEQFYGKGSKESENTMMIGMILFIVGWLAVTYMVSIYDKKSINIMALISSLVILISASTLGWAMTKYGTKNMPQWSIILVLLFVVGWLTLGYSVSEGKNNMAMILGIGSAISVLLSMVVTLPMQRSKCVVDGPGMALFALGWVGIAIVNSM